MLAGTCVYAEAVGMRCTGGRRAQSGSQAVHTVMRRTPPSGTSGDPSAGTHRFTSTALLATETGTHVRQARKSQFREVWSTIVYIFECLG